MNERIHTKALVPDVPAPGPLYISCCQAGSKYSALNIMLHVARLDVFVCYGEWDVWLVSQPSEEKCGAASMDSLWTSSFWTEVCKVKLCKCLSSGMFFMCTVLTFKYVVSVRVCLVGTQHTVNIWCLDVWRVVRWVYYLLTFSVAWPHSQNCTL
jgi:hypothetical protein